MKKVISLISVLALLYAYPAYALTENTHSTSLVRTSSQYWSIPDASQTGLDVTTAFSLAFRANLNSTGIGQTVIAKVTDGGGSNLAYLLAIYPTNKICLDISDDGSLNNGRWQRYCSDSALFTATGTWYSFLVSVNMNSGSPVVAMYLDGSSAASSKTNGTTIGSSIANTAATLHIGWGQNFTTNPDHVNGLLDDVRIFNAALSSTDASDLHNTPCSFNPASTQAFWAFDNDGLDQTANNNDLTNNNSATFSTTHAYDCAAATTADFGATLFFGDW